MDNLSHQETRGGFHYYRLKSQELDGTGHRVAAAESLELASVISLG